jgi:two-component system LytT family response regulator
MPGRSGLDVVEAVGAEAMPLTVFVTAYDQYAIQAFEVAAVDYLLKPFDDERFAEAFERARRRLEEKERRAATDTLRDLLREHRGEGGEGEEEGGDYLERIAVQGRGETRIVSVSALTHVTADGSYAELHTREGDTHLIRERMKTLADRLDPDVFMRIHRSVIVRLDAVASILRGGGGDYGVRLHDDTRLRLSRSRVDELEERLGIG